MGVSLLQATKRALVSILLSIASQYGLDLKLTRDHPDSAVQTAYRRVALKAHPDKGGDEEIAKELFAAKAAWDDARKSSSKKARPMHRPNHSRPPRREKKATGKHSKGKFTPQVQPQKARSQVEGNM